MDFDCKSKNAKHRCHQQIYYKLKNRGGGLFPEVESKTQGSRPRPKTQKKSEAKAKDTKKFRGQGQGQPFRGLTHSRPRTGMLEAKAKDQGHKRKCSPKKKGLRKNFLGDLRKK